MLANLAERLGTGARLRLLVAGAAILVLAGSVALLTADSDDDVSTGGSSPSTASTASTRRRTTSTPSSVTTATTSPGGPAGTGGTVPPTEPTPPPEAPADPIPRRSGVYIAALDGSAPRLVAEGAAGQGPGDYGWAPDGLRIAFTRGGSLWVANADGTAPKRIVTGDPAQFVVMPSLRWSPDGRWLAFGASKASSATVRLVAPDGSGGREVSPKLRTNSPLAWSPDSTRLAFVGQGLDVYDVASGRLRTIVTGTVAPTLAWSADGTQLAFDGGGSVDVIGADGTARRTVVGLKGKSTGPLAWSPAGTPILYAPFSTGPGSTYAVEVDGTRNRKLLAGAGDGAHWSPTGDRVAFLVTGALNPDGTYDTDIGVAGADGVRQTTIDFGDNLVFQPRWSPDGTRLLIGVAVP